MLRLMLGGAMCAAVSVPAGAAVPGATWLPEAAVPTPAQPDADGGERDGSPWQRARATLPRA